MAGVTGVSRLSSSRDYEQLARDGRYLAGEVVSVRWAERPSLQGARVGLAVSRKIGGAVQRNRIKRQLRAALYAVVERSSLVTIPGRDVVLIAGPEVSGIDFQELVLIVRRKLAETGLLAPSLPVGSS